MPKILVVEDDAAVAASVKERLTEEFQTVDLVGDIRSAQDYLAVNSYDLMVVDWNLPDGSGIGLCENLRAKGSQMPILLLTGNDRLEHKETGFTAGADDYLTKPFAMKELVLRITALLRRPANLVTDVLSLDDLTVDLKTYQVTKAGKKVPLPPREFALLHFFMRHLDTVFTSEALIERVWPSDSEMTPETVRKYVCRIRDKIDNAEGPSRIQNVHGVGYSFVSRLDTVTSVSKKQSKAK